MCCLTFGLWGFVGLSAFGRLEIRHVGMLGLLWIEAFVSVGLWGCWVLWRFGLLGFGDVGLLGVWDVGPLSCWAFGFVSSRAFGFWDFWNLGLLGTN